METKASKQIKQLRELLQQQQEPFILEVYLSEKGCSKRPCSSSVNHLPKLLKAFCKKLFDQTLRKDVFNKRERKTSAKKVRDSAEVAELDRFSSASSTTIYNSCTESDAEDKLVSLRIQHPQPHMILNQTEEVKLGLAEKGNMCSATEQSFVRQPHETVQDEARMKELNVPTYRIFQPKDTTEDSILSASILEILFKSTKDKLKFDKVAESSQLITFHIHHEYLSSKRSLQQTKQLLFDCVREVIESHGKKERVKQGELLVLGAENIGKLICERIVAWGKRSGNENSIDELLHSDIVDTAEWENHVPQKMEISMEVGDAILEDIRNEIITEMTGFVKF